MTAVPATTRPDRPRRLAGTLAVLLLAVSVPLLALLAARMPVRLVTVAPVDGALLQAPPRALSLTFSAAPDPGQTHVSVRTPSGVTANGPPRVDGRTVTLPVDVTAAGRYLAGYHVGFDNGRTLTGLVSFTVAGTPASTPQDRPAADPGGGGGGRPAPPPPRAAAPPPAT